jgi:hypothetical protein
MCLTHVSTSAMSDMKTAGFPRLDVVAGQIVRGEQMKKLVPELDDPKLKQLIDH